MNHGAPHNPPSGWDLHLGAPPVGRSRGIKPDPFHQPLACFLQNGGDRLCAAIGPGEEPHAAERPGQQGAGVQNQPARRGQHPAA